MVKSATIFEWSSSLIRKHRHEANKDPIVLFKDLPLQLKQFTGE